MQQPDNVQPTVRAEGAMASNLSFVVVVFWGCSRLQGKKGDLDKAYRVDKDLAAAEAKRLIAMEKRQEDDAYLLSREYDDDYDDQVLHS